MPFSRIEVVRDPVTQMATDAIVTFTDETLKADSGDLARQVHRVAGPALRRECRRLQGCEAGKAKISRGYDLPARHVIHTVPHNDGHHGDEPKVVASCYRSSLELAAKHELQSIAFPLLDSDSLSVEREAEIALGEISSFLDRHSRFERVIVCCGSRESYDQFCQRIETRPQ